MTKYILNNKKDFEIFLKKENLMKNGKFQIMSKFEGEEFEFWLKSLNKHLSKNDKIIEIGCGSGRILRKLLQSGFTPIGFDNNKYFVNYCKNQGLDVFYFDATKNVLGKHKNKYKAVGIALNTLFNFPKSIRKKWVDTACDLLSSNGFLMFSVYSDSKFSRSTVKERIKLYNATFQHPKGYSIGFFDNNTERGIQLTNPKRKREWFSEWIKKDALISEIHSWKRFRIIKINQMKCGIGFNVLLQKD